MSALEILREIESIAQDDISNYLEFRTEKTVAGYEDGEPIFDYRPIVALKDSRNINTKNISEVSLGANGTFKFKLYSREAALTRLAELQGVDVLRKAKQRLSEDRFEYEKLKDEKNDW
jgi:phage terminase small subunit